MKKLIIVLEIVLGLGFAGLGFAEEVVYYGCVHRLRGDSHMFGEITIFKDKKDIWCENYGTLEVRRLFKMISIDIEELKKTQKENNPVISPTKTARKQMWERIKALQGNRD